MDGVIKSVSGFIKLLSKRLGLECDSAVLCP